MGTDYSGSLIYGVEVSDTLADACLEKVGITATTRGAHEDLANHYLLDIVCSGDARVGPVWVFVGVEPTFNNEAASIDVDPEALERLRIFLRECEISVEPEWIHEVSIS